jgi:hypothetical protein
MAKAKKEKKEKKGKKKGQKEFSGGGSVTAGSETPKDFEAIPAGKYPSQLVKCEKKPTAAGTGFLMDSQFRISSGDYENRIVFNNLNLDNPSDQAEEIAIEQLKNFIAAAGLKRIESKWDWTPLLNIPVIIHVKVDKGDGTYADTNSIRGYSPVESHDDTGKKNKKNKKDKKDKKDKKPNWSKK